MMGLRELRTLKRVSIDVDNVEAFSLKHLNNFNHLGGPLLIKWSKRGDGEVEDAKQANLQEKKHITRLQLNFGWGETEERKRQDEELAEALNVPPNLEILRMKYYMGLTTPSWLDSLTVVKLVNLNNWSYCEHLPYSFGKLPCLEDLGLQRFDRVRKVGAEFLAMDDEMKFSSSSTTVPLFPKLTSLEFKGFRDWEEWNDVDGDEEMLIMPSLAYLNLSSCPKLKALPNFILKRTTSLKLNISNCDSLKQFTSR